VLNIHHDELQPSRVTVAFEHSALSFMMSKDATLEDLADRLDRLGKRRHGKPVAIAVKLGAASDVHTGTPDNLGSFRTSHRDRTSTTLELANAGRQ
jgi:hypothetical protein